VSVDTVLVTGAFGQIGKRCIDILLDRGRTVVAADLSNDATRAVAEQYSARTSPGTLVPVYADLRTRQRSVNSWVTTNPGRLSIWQR
jgi:UDP-glucose 4-epimerase